MDIGIMGEQEMCCAARPYSMGYREVFSQFAEANINAWAKAGVKTVVTSCSDGYHAFKRLYPQLGSQVEVLHTVEFIDRLIDMAEEAGIEVTIENAPFPPGIDWRDEINYKEYPAGHLFGGHNQSNVLKILEDNALKNGADIRYQVRASQLIQEENGRVSGLIAKDQHGDYIQFNAVNAVILCTGDYGSILR